ncbi:MAG: hypothetical protein ABJL17_05590 [Parvibaculum sp.]
MKRNIARWTIATLFALVGTYVFLWAVQSASFSVTLDPVVAAYYQTRAIVLYPLSVVYFALAVVFFILLGER